MKVGIIAAMTPDGVIGVDGALPWHYKADLQRFKRLTMDSSIIFGSKTYDSLPGKLPGREIFVLTRATLDRMGKPGRPRGLMATMRDALISAKFFTKTDTVWIGGGGMIYREALAKNLVDFIDLTIVPPVEIPEKAEVTRFPVDLLVGWSLIEEVPNPDDPRLLQRRFERSA